MYMYSPPHEPGGGINGDSHVSRGGMGHRVCLLACVLSAIGGSIVSARVCVFSLQL
jgi:hypothetical protein